jgi:hypothetical protein
MSSAVVEAKARYSASAVDRDTVACFLVPQDIKLLPKKIANPVVERLSSLQPAQSASQKPQSS